MLISDWYLSVHISCAKWNICSYHYICTGKPLPVGLDQGGSCSCSLSMIEVFLFSESLGMSGFWVLRVI
jgi:hypothetical protein